MGMNVHVYRLSSGDADGDALSNRYTALCITNVPGPFSPTEDKPGAVLIRQETGNLIVVPQAILESGHWFTCGGNYAYSSDNRFTDVIDDMAGYPYAFPVAIHDRTE